MEHVCIPGYAIRDPVICTQTTWLGRDHRSSGTILLTRYEESEPTLLDQPGVRSEVWQMALSLLLGRAHHWRLPHKLHGCPPVPFFYFLRQV